MLDVVDDGRVRLVRFNRPEARNAFNEELYHAAGRALEEANSRPDIACVVLTGSGHAFCAGQDLGEMGRLRPDASPADFGAQGPGFPHFCDTLAALERPVVAAVNGAGVGIGFTMLLHCDLVLMAATARLRAPFVPLGVVPEAAGSLMMPLVMGNQRAALKLYTGEWITAGEAVEYGIALRTVPDDRVLDEALELARVIAAMPVASLRETKRLVVAARIDAVRAARAREDAAFTKMIGQPANLEAITAFLERRDPDFTKL
jgi:enoyl-CoA hydratase/carnithine racemase